jgi:hypothetical protein
VDRPQARKALWFVALSVVMGIAIGFVKLSDDGFSPGQILLIGAGVGLVVAPIARLRGRLRRKAFDAGRRAAG